MALEESLLPFPRENFETVRNGGGTLSLDQLSPELQEVARTNIVMFGSIYRGCPLRKSAFPPTIQSCRAK